MLTSFLGRIPSGMVLFCTFLAFVIPYSVYWVNKKLHKYGDPPWKAQETNMEEQKKPQQNSP